MKRIDTKHKDETGNPIPAYYLEAGERLPKEFNIPANNNTYIISNDTVHIFRYSPIMSTISPPKSKMSLWEFEQEFLPEGTYIDRGYTPNTVYLADYQCFDGGHIERNDMLEVMAYFRKIFELHKTECGIVLMYHPVTKRYKPLFVLQYNLSKGHVDYIRPNVIETNDHEANKILEKHRDKQNKINAEYNSLVDEGYILFGTMHSHCDFSAFHSSVDDGDEFKFDGLHITLGHVDKEFSIEYRWIVSGADFEDKLTLKELTGVESISHLAPFVDAVEVPQERIDLAIPEEKKYYQGGFQGNFHEGWHGYSGSWRGHVDGNETVMQRKARNLLESKDDSDDITQLNSDEPSEDETIDLNDMAMDIDDILLIKDPENIGRILAITQEDFVELEPSPFFVPLTEIVPELQLTNAVKNKIRGMRRRTRK